MQSTIQTLNVVGCGKVGQTLSRLFHQSGACKIQDLSGEHLSQVENAAKFIGAGRPTASLRDMRSADLWLLAVPDTAVAKVAAELAEALQGQAQPASTAFHCSGFLPASALTPLRGLGFRLASIHPVLTFADPAAAVDQFPGTPCGIEGDQDALTLLSSLFKAIKAQCFPVQPERKALYHAAAVFANNFTVVLQSIAREAWKEAGVPDGLIGQIQSSLLLTTAENVGTLGPRAITGPAARGDFDVVRLQGAEVFRWHPEAGVIYQELSRLANRLAVHQSTQSPFENQ